MAQSEASSHIIVEMMQREPQAGPLGFLLGPRHKVPAIDGDFDLFALAGFAAGIPEPELVLLPNDDALSAHEGDEAFVRVRRQTQPLELGFSACVNDRQSRAWDLVLTGFWSVSGSRRFLTAQALAMVSPQMPLTKQLAESWMANTIRPYARDALASHSLEDLRDRDALPAAWWEAQINRWLGGYGVSVKVVDCHWGSAEADRAETERRQQEYCARTEEERERARQAELRQEKANADYAKERARIEVDLRLSASERDHQLELLEERHRTEILEAQAETARAKHAAEREAFEHELALAGLRRDAEAFESAKEREEEADRRYKDVESRLSSTMDLLEKLAAVAAPLLAAAAGKDAGKAHDAAERLTSPEFGVRPDTLAAMGYAVTQQSLVQYLREQAAGRKRPVVLKMVELRTRSIDSVDLLTRDVTTAKVNALPVGRSLQFEFTAPQAGHVTVLNIGTSGRSYVHVPNAYVDREAAKVPSGRSYVVPGSELLPWERLREHSLEYVENGPPGWEHMAVVVSEEPLIGQNVMCRATPGGPLVELTAGEFEGFCAGISRLEPGSWSAGVLDFLVPGEVQGTSRPVACPAGSEGAKTVVAVPGIDLRSLAAGTVVSGRYTILAKAGEGGLGVVYKARKEALKRTVALKFLLAEGAQGKERVSFLREAILGAQIEHPNVVAVYDVAEHMGHPFIEMQFVEGESAADRIKRTARFCTKEAVSVIRQALAGLDAGWRKGIVHCDVKPQNILIGSDGTVKVADFGLARCLRSGPAVSLPSLQGVMGTVEYMAPEQWKGREPDARTDVYALGLALYALVTGRKAFGGPDAPAVMHQHLEVPVPWTEADVAVPAPLRLLIERMAAKDRANRPAGASELDACLASLPDSS